MTSSDIPDWQTIVFMLREKLINNLKINKL